MFREIDQAPQRSANTLYLGFSKLITYLAVGRYHHALGIADGLWIVILVILQPLIASCFFPAGYAALSLVVPKTIQNVAVSFTVPLGFVIGGGMFPVLIGIAGDAGSFATGIIIAGVLIFTGAALTRYLKCSQ